MSYSEAVQSGAGRSSLMHVAKLHQDLGQLDQALEASRRYLSDIQQTMLRPSLLATLVAIGRGAKKGGGFACSLRMSALSFFVCFFRMRWRAVLLLLSKLSVGRILAPCFVLPHMQQRRKKCVPYLFRRFYRFAANLSRFLLLLSPHISAQALTVRVFWCLKYSRAA